MTTGVDAGLRLPRPRPASAGCGTLSARSDSYRHAHARRPHNRPLPRCPLAGKKVWPITVGRPIATISPHSTVGCRSAAFGWRRRARSSRSPRLAPEQWLQGALHGALSPGCAASTATCCVRVRFRSIRHCVDLLRLGRPLPKALSEADVDRPAGGADTGDPLGLRIGQCSRCSMPAACGSPS